MLTPYHIEIMLNSLGNLFSPRALSAIMYANINQDRLGGQFGHDEFHFDNNAFEKSYAYIEEQRALTFSSLHRNDARSAWSSFGKLTHTAHDFYAHSNYITLWISRFDGRTPPPALEVDPVDPSLLASPDLRSGKTYYPFELLYFWRPARKFALQILPRDSHAWMNLDSPEQGFKFDYAMQAATKRTIIEYQETIAGIPQERRRLFEDR
jgi:hypothetical protein